MSAASRAESAPLSCRGSWRTPLTWKETIGLVLGAIAALLCVSQWMAIRSVRRDHARGVERSYSSIPLVALVFGLLAWAHAPGPSWIWLVFGALDPGTIAVLAVPVFALRSKDD